MKKEIIYLSLSLSLGFLPLNAQIKIRKDDVVEKAVFKPKQFDSLSNIAMQKNIINYKKYIGYKLFYLPPSTKYKEDKIKIIDFLHSDDTLTITKKDKIHFDKVYIYAAYRQYKDSKKLKGNNLKIYNEKKKKYDETIDKEKTDIYNPKFYYSRTQKDDGAIIGKIGTLPKTVEGKYFKIMDIKAKKGGKYEELEDIEDYNDRSIRLKIKLKNEETQKQLYWIVDEARNLNGKMRSYPFFLVPYFEKQREIYLNKNLVLKYSDRTNKNLKNLVNVNTGETIDIKYGDVWTCSDISFIESKDSYYLKCFYFLKKGDEEIKIDIKSMLLRDYFMLESEFKQQKLEKKLKEEEIKKEKAERQKLEEQKRITLKKELIAKWGKKKGTYIADGKVLLGMNKEMCIAAWGNPISVNRTIVRGLTSEQWVYGWGTYLYFDNKELTTIQD